MLLVVGTFVVVLVIVTGIYWVMLERPETHEQDKLRKRLRTAAPKIAKRIDFVKEAEKLSSVKSLDTALTHARKITDRLQRLIAQADMKMTVGSLLLSSACLFLAAWLAIGWITRLYWLAFAVGALLMFVPFMVVRFKANKRMRKFEEQFPESIDLIARALRAGHAFTTGLSIVAEEAPQPVAGEFRLLYDQQNFGMPLDEALKAFAERLPSLDARPRPHHRLGTLLLAAITRCWASGGGAAAHDDARHRSDGPTLGYRRAALAGDRNADHPETGQHRVLGNNDDARTHLRGRRPVRVGGCCHRIHGSRSHSPKGASQATSSRNRDSKRSHS
jgi:hypothetical protein